MNFNTRRRRVRHSDLDLKGIFGKFKGFGKSIVAKLKAGGRVDDIVAAMKKNLQAASETLNKHPKGKKALQVSGAALGVIAAIGAGIYGLKVLQKKLEQIDFSQVPAFIKFVDAHPEWFSGDVRRRLNPFLNKLEALYQAGDVERGEKLLISIDGVCADLIATQTSLFGDKAAEIERILSEAERTIKLDAMFRRRRDKSIRHNDLIERFPGGFTEPASDYTRNHIATKYNPDFAKFQSALYSKNSGMFRKMLDAVKRAFALAKRGLAGKKVFETAARFFNSLAGKTGDAEQKRALKKLAIGLGVAGAAAAGLSAVVFAIKRRGRRNDYQATIAFINSYEAGRYPEIVSPDMNSAIAAMKAADAAGDIKAFWIAEAAANEALEMSKRKYSEELNRAQMTVYSNVEWV